MHRPIKWKNIKWKNIKWKKILCYQCEFGKLLFMFWITLFNWQCRSLTKVSEGYKTYYALQTQLSLHKNPRVCMPDYRKRGLLGCLMCMYACINMQDWGGVGGHAPPENFRNLIFWDCFEVILGWKQRSSSYMGHRLLLPIFGFPYISDINAKFGINLQLWFLKAVILLVQLRYGLWHLHIIHCPWS